MSIALNRYLDRVMVYAKRSDEDTVRIRAELEDHLLQKIDNLKADGVSTEDALFRAIEDHGNPRVVGYALRPKFPLIDVRAHGTARGVIAIGPRAVGVIAIGGAAFGVISFGGFAAGLFSIGGFGLALLFTWAGFGVAPIAYAGFALGLAAYGGFACGIVSTGGFACGVWAEGGIGWSYYPGVENMPAWLRLFLPQAAHMTRLIYITGAAALLIMLPAIIAGNLLQWRERKRIDAALSWVDE